MSDNNIILHYECGVSDKIYVCCIRQELDGTWSSVGKYGRRGRLLKSSVRLSGVWKFEAKMNQVAKSEEQIRKGYVDVECPEYKGVVTRKSLRFDLEFEGPDLGREELQEDEREELQEDDLDDYIEDDMPKVLEGADADEDAGIVVCIDNSGIESFFDLDVEYVSDSCRTDEIVGKPTKGMMLHRELLLVYDKFGKKVLCFKDRFKVGRSDAVISS